MQGTDEELSNGLPIYTFQRNVTMPLDTILHQIGSPCKRTGLVKQYFRPSDDACTYPFNIPANAFICVCLEQTGNFLKKLQQEIELSNKCIQMAKQINESIYKHGIATDSQGIKYFVYEIDGYGNQLFMDDANIPSLLSLPYLGFVSHQDSIYQQTRKKLLSFENQYYFEGKILKGIGSPHIIQADRRAYVWPMSIVMQALTSNNEEEIINCIKMILRSSNGTYYMHEGVHKDDPKKFTRAWFAWANSLFGELILHLFQTKSVVLNYDFNQDLI